MSDGLTIRNAATRLACTQQHVRLLARRGELVATGQGQDRRVTAESVERYGSSKKRRIYASKNTNISLPVFVESVQDRIMERMKSLPPLSEPKRAARELGIAPVDFNRLIAAGHVPTIDIGPIRFVGRRWLAETLERANGFRSPGVSR